LLKHLYTALVITLSITHFANSDETADLKKLLHGQLGREATVIAFTGVSCPVSNRYVPRLNELSKEFSAKGVSFINFNSNPGETALDVALHAKEYEINYPVYKDINHIAADYFHAEKTPQVFLLDKNGNVKYEGRVDGQYGVGHATTLEQGRFDLKEAIDEVLAGKPVSETKTQAIGCLLTRDYDNKVNITYGKEVSRIIQNKCQTCHRPDGVAGFYPWMDYSDVFSMADMIKTVVVERRMPPWHADPNYGIFANDRSMSKEDMNTLVSWVDAGCLEGDAADLPEPRKYPTSRFTIGEPDHIIYMPKEFNVPADGVVDYQYFMIDEEVKEDMWVQRAEAVMDTPAVHHIILFIIPPGKDPRESREILAGSAPGDLPLVLEEGVALKVEKGSRFMIEMHYTPIGKEVTDRSYIGLKFAEGPVEKELRGNPLGKQDFAIAPNDANYTEIAEFMVKEDIEVLSFAPHMHFRGKSWKSTAIYPDGREEILLNVPKYDFNWQGVYRYDKKPLLPKGTKLICEAVWDNSSGNPFNPDPSQTVHYGEQTWEEMMFGFIQYLHVDDLTINNRAISRIDDKKKK
jgi:hypothetical protein